MDNSGTLSILKNAFLMEKKGKTLYEKAKESAQNDKVKSFFQELVDDEQEHMNLLEGQFKAFQDKGKFSAGNFDIDENKVNAPVIIDDELKGNINAASFEATAITAAISFEEKAVRLYAKQGEEAVDPEEKKMYKWLSAWETTHLKKLVVLEESLIENVWNDNNFWPF